MSTQFNEEIQKAVQSFSYEIPRELEDEISSSLQLLLLQKTVDHQKTKDELARSSATVSSLNWQLEQERIKPPKIEYRVEKVSTGYISLKEHDRIRLNLAKKLKESENSVKTLKDNGVLNAELTETNKSLVNELSDLKPALEQSHEANRQLMVKLSKSKDKVSSAVKRENESAGKFIKAEKSFQQELTKLRSERAQYNSSTKMLNDKLKEALAELKDARELVAISGKQVLWENKRRGTWLTYLGVQPVGEERPSAVDGTELDMNKPVFSFHHPNGISRMVLCGTDEENAVIFAANTAVSMPTAFERKEISELIADVNFEQVQEHFDKKQAELASRTTYVAKKAKQVNNSNVMSKAKARKALKELRAGGDISPETANVVTGAAVLAEHDSLSRDEKVDKIKRISSKMSESKRAKNRAKRKKKK